MPKGHSQYNSSLHWREAARFALVSWPDFCELTTEQQAGIIAHYEIIKRLESLEAQFRMRRAKRGK